MTRLFVYRVDHDRGLAPNPFFDICSLAVCKPRIRAKAVVGDLVVGTSSYERNKVNRSGIAGGRIIYIMRVTAVTDFEAYHRDFPRKRPNMKGCMLRRAGDAIYERDVRSGDWLQADSLHSSPNGVLFQDNLVRDTGTTENVLLSTNYTYWGRNAPELPLELAVLARKAVREQHTFPPRLVGDFERWAKGQLGRGLRGLPLDWDR